MIRAQEQYSVGMAGDSLPPAGRASGLSIYMEGMGWAAGIYTLVILLALLVFNPSLTHTKPGKMIIVINWVLVIALIENPQWIDNRSKFFWESPALPC